MFFNSLKWILSPENYKSTHNFCLKHSIYFLYLKICLILQIPHEALVASMANLVLYLKAPSVVVHSYAAHTIERILMVKKPDGSGPVWVVIMKLWLHGLKKFVDHAASLRKVEYMYYDIFIQIDLALHVEIKFYSQKITSYILCYMYLRYEIQ